MCCEIQHVEKAGLENRAQSQCCLLGDPKGSRRRELALLPQAVQRKITARERPVRHREEKSKRLSWKVMVRS